jgi:hypothetical protein
LVFAVVHGDAFSRETVRNTLPVQAGMPADDSHPFFE